MSGPADEEHKACALGIKAGSMQFAAGMSHGCCCQDPTRCLGPLLGAVGAGRCVGLSAACGHH